MPVANGAIPDRGQKRQLAVASHHRRLGSGRTGEGRSDRKPRADQSLLALRVDGCQSLVFDRVSCQSVGLLAHDETAGGR